MTKIWTGREKNKLVNTCEMYNNMVEDLILDRLTPGTQFRSGGGQKHIGYSNLIKNGKDYQLPSFRFVLISKYYTLLLYF